MGSCTSSNKPRKHKTLESSTMSDMIRSSRKAKTFSVRDKPLRLFNPVTNHALYLASLLKTPIHDVIKNPIFGFQDRLARDLIQAHPSSIKPLLNVFQQFILEVSYSLEKNKQPRLQIEELISRGFYPVTIRLDPFLDLVWREFIIYTKPYYRLSSLMVGKCLDRAPKDPYFDLTWALRVWPNYTYPMAVYESGYMIWTSLDEYYEMVKMLAKHYFTYIEPKSKAGKIKVEDVMACLNICLNTFKHQVNNQSQALEAEEFDFKLSPSVENIPVKDKLQEIRQIVSKPRLKDTIQRELNLTQDLAALYIEEYCAFLTMIFYSAEELTPSDEIDQVWHTHQGFSYKYRKFCLKIYGSLIIHNPTTGGRVSKEKYDMQYNRTLSFYQYLFSKPPSSLWPDISTRFGGFYEKCCWVSLFRVLAIISSYKNYVPTDSNNDISIFYYIRKNYMNWPVSIKDRFEFLRQGEYKGVNYSIDYETDIRLATFTNPSNQDILSSNISAYKSIKLKKDAASNQADQPSSKTTTTVQTKVAKYDAQIYANKQLNFTSLAYFKIKPAIPSYIITKNKEVYLSSEHFPIILLNVRNSNNPNFEKIEDLGAALNVGDWELEYTVGSGGDSSPRVSGVLGSLGRRTLGGKIGAGNCGDGLLNIMN